MRLELRPQAFTASVSGTRTLTGGGVYAYLNGTAGRFTPGVSTGDAGPEKDEITLRAGSVDLSSRSAYNRKLIAGAVYASENQSGKYRDTQRAFFAGVIFEGWTIDIASAIAWPVISFQDHVHNITDWTIDALCTVEWEPLADGGAWDWPIDIRSSVTWQPLHVQADWNIDMRAGVAWELSTGTRITDPGDNSAWRIDITSLIEWESIYGAGIDDWTIDMASSLKWVTYTEVKDLLCVVGNEDTVGEVPAAAIENSVY